MRYLKAAVALLRIYWVYLVPPLAAVLFFVLLTINTIAAMAIFIVVALPSVIVLSSRAEKRELKSLIWDSLRKQFKACNSDTGLGRTPSSCIGSGWIENLNFRLLGVQLTDSDLIIERVFRPSTGIAIPWAEIMRIDEGPYWNKPNNRRPNIRFAKIQFAREGIEAITVPWDTKLRDQVPDQPAYTSFPRNSRFG